MKLRSAKLEDAKEILSLLIKTPELQGCGEIDAIYSEDYIIDCIKDKNLNFVVVAEEDSRIVGLLIAEIWDQKKYSFFVDFVVLRDCRSKGIGTKLYQYYEEHCKKHDIKTIIALVRTSNKIMQEFCKNKNYKKGNEFYFYEKEIFAPKI